MKKRMIGNLEVSEIGMGCMGFSHGYGKVPEEGYALDAVSYTHLDVYKRQEQSRIKCGVGRCLYQRTGE